LDRFGEFTLSPKSKCAPLRFLSKGWMSHGGNYLWARIEENAGVTRSRSQRLRGKVKIPTLISPKSGEIRMGHPAGSKIGPFWGVYPFA